MYRKNHTRKAEYLFPIVCSVSIVAAAHIIFMLFSGKNLLSSNPYNSYIRQAIAWSQGRLCLPENYSWLELAYYKGDYFVSFPPFPSYILFPFTIFFGEDAPDSLVSFCIMLLGVHYAVCIAKHCGLNDWQSIFVSTFLYCANNVWMVTVDAWVWFFAQNMAFTLTLMSFYYGSISKFGRSLFFLAAAVGCRPFQIIYLPIILYWLVKSELNTTVNFKQLFLRRIYRFIPAVLLGASYMILNFLRFDHPFEFGHNYLPEFIQAEHGQFSVIYLKDNIHRLFELPTIDAATEKLIFQGFNGTNIFIVFPAFVVFLFLAAKLIYTVLNHQATCNTQEYVFIGLTVLLTIVHILLLCAHKTMGGAHFGNRYVIDILPAVYLVLIKILALQPKKSIVPKHLSQKLTEILCAICYISGLLINFVGVLSFYSKLNA